MSSIMRRRNGLIAWSVMGRLLSGVRVATPHLQTGRASYLSPPRAPGGGALPRERFSPLAQMRSARCPLFGRYEGKSGRRGYRCYCARNLYATIRATMLAKISSAERDFRIMGLVEWGAADRPG